MAEAERRKWCGRGRGTLAQEVEQERRPAGRGGAEAAASLRETESKEQEAEVATWYIDQDLVDEYLSVPHVKTIHSILSRMDPRYDWMVVCRGIEHGGYRAALEKLLKDPPPRHPRGMRVADYRARMLERLGRYEQAEALYRDQSAELDGNPESQLDMARVLEHLGRREESAEALARACKLDPDCRLAFEAGMHPDPRQLDPAAVPLRLIIPMSVISAAGTVRSRAELSAASLLAQAECGLDLYPPAASRLPGCAGLGADMERFYHLVVEDIISHPTGGEPTHYYDLTDRGIDMVRELGERADGNEGGGGASARIAASARRIAGIGAHAILEEACRAAAAQAGRERTGRAEALAGLRGTAERIICEIGNGIAFGGNHASVLESMALDIPDMLSQARDAPDAQWDVAAALGGDILGLCARIAFDQRPHPRSYALGPPYPDIRDLYELLVGYCKDRGIAELGKEVSKIREPAPEEIEETRRDMLRVMAGS